jgi:hypothetical protein
LAYAQYGSGKTLHADALHGSKFLAGSRSCFGQNQAALKLSIV